MHEDIVRRLKAENANWARICKEQARRIDELEALLAKALDELKGSMK